MRTGTGGGGEESVQSKTGSGKRRGRGNGTEKRKGRFCYFLLREVDRNGWEKGVGEGWIRGQDEGEGGEGEWDGSVDLGGIGRGERE